MSHIINEATVKEIAKLARLTITNEEIADYLPHLTKVLNHFSELKSLNTDQIEPLVSPVDVSICLRQDHVEKKISSDELLKLAPSKVGHLFKVPPVI